MQLYRQENGLETVNGLLESPGNVWYSAGGKLPPAVK
jgi:hypothetical protein